MANIIDIKIPKGNRNALRIPPNDARRQQIKVLKKLLKKARFTEFGQQYRFDDTLLSKQPKKNSRSWYLSMTIIKYMKNGGKKHWMVYPM